MNIFGKKFGSLRRDDREIAPLEEMLSRHTPAELTKDEHQAMKSHVFSLLKNREEELYSRNDAKLIDKIAKLRQRIYLSRTEKAALKERIFQAIEHSAFHTGIIPSRVSRYFKTALSSFMLFFFVLSAVVIFPFQVPILHAARLTYLDEVKGDVMVYRDGEQLIGAPDFALQQGDLIFTQPGSTASVRFFDDSVSRLDGNTQLQLKRIYAEPLNPVVTQVDLALGEGRLWTKVLNLVDDRSHFMVETSSAAISVNKKATFNLESQSSVTTLTVYDNVVEMSSRETLSLPDKKPVLAGFSAKIASGGDLQVEKSQALIASESSEGKAWVAANLEKDQVHDQTISSENEQILAENVDKITSKDLAQLDNGSRKFTHALLEEQRVFFLDSYYNNLMLGETYLMRQQEKKGMDLMLQFKGVVRTLQSRMVEFQKVDSMEAELLRSLVQSKLAEQKKNLMVLLPGDRLYPAKELIEDSELLFASNEVERIQIQLSQADNKLLDTQKALKMKNNDLAEALLVRYQRQVDNIVLPVNISDLDQIRTQINRLFEKQIDQMKSLTVIEKSLAGSGSPLLTSVRTIRHGLLSKLVAAFKDFDSKVPLDLLVQLRNFLKIYWSFDGQYDQKFIDSLNNTLRQYGERGFTETSKLPDSLGVIILVEDQATAEISSQKPTEQLLHSAPTMSTTQSVQIMSQTQQAVSNTSIINASVNFNVTDVVPLLQKKR